MASETRMTRREQRETRRAQERARRDAAARRARTTRYIAYGVIALLVVLGIALAAGPLTARLNQSAALGQQFPEQSRDHINPGQTHAAYTSNPPTSGPHYPSALRWGTFDTPQADEFLVHNLEHGGIVINYNCPDGCPDVVQQLKDFMTSYKSKVILAPRPDPTVPWRITMTAWRWLDGFNDVDVARMKAFVDAHKDKGPEVFPD